MPSSGLLELPLTFLEELLLMLSLEKLLERTTNTCYLRVVWSTITVSTCKERPANGESGLKLSKNSPLLLRLNSLMSLSPQLTLSE